MKRGSKRRLKHISVILVFLAVTVILLDNAGKTMFPVKYKEYVLEYSARNNVDPYLVFAIIKAESSFNPSALSPQNARGLMQITEKTGQWGAKVLKIKEYDKESLFNPDVNISIGCWYLGVLSKEFGDNLDLVLAAYNGGSGNVSEWLKNRELSNTGKSLDKIPFKETETYIKRVKNYLSIYKKLYENSF